MKILKGRLLNTQILFTFLTLPSDSGITLYITIVSQASLDNDQNYLEANRGPKKKTPVTTTQQCYAWITIGPVFDRGTKCAAKRTQHEFLCGKVEEYQHQHMLLVSCDTKTLLLPLHWLNCIKIPSHGVVSQRGIYATMEFAARAEFDLVLPWIVRYHYSLVTAVTSILLGKNLA